MSQQTNGEAQATKRGFGELPCPLCGADADITVSLTDGETFFCTSCEADFTPATVETFIAKWRPVLAWLRAAPARD